MSAPQEWWQLRRTLEQQTPSLCNTGTETEERVRRYSVRNTATCLRTEQIACNDDNGGDEDKDDDNAPDHFNSSAVNLNINSKLHLFSDLRYMELS